MKIIDSFLEKEKADSMHSELVEKFQLDQYNSINCYDSNKDFSRILDHKHISLNLFKNKKPYQLIINSFQKYCRCMGPHSLSKSIFMTLLLSPKDFQGGDLFFPHEEWTPRSPTLGSCDKFEAKHNRLIVGSSKSQRLMSQIFDSTGPLIYITLDIE